MDEPRRAVGLLDKHALKGGVSSPSGQASDG